MLLSARTIIEDPSFDSQTKEYLTTNQSKFGSTCNIDKKFIEKLAKSDITKRIIELTEFKENIKTKKTDGKKKNVIKGIAKLEDANKAGTKDSDKCILNLTEGDSAKAFVMGGIKNKDFEGIFPLKGKLMRRLRILRKFLVFKNLNLIRISLKYIHRLMNLDMVKFDYVWIRT